MKATFQSGRLSIEVEGEKQKDVFGELARAQEVFQHEACGKCKGGELRFVVRNVDDNDFYEIHCLDRQCRARLAFGQHKGKEGTLFPRRKNSDSEWLPNGGWMKYNPTTGKEE